MERSKQCDFAQQRENVPDRERFLLEDPSHVSENVIYLRNMRSQNAIFYSESAGKTDNFVELGKMEPQ